MTDELNNDDLDLDISNILDDEDEVSVQNLPPEPRRNPRDAEEAAIYKAKVSKLEKDLASFKDALEAKKGSNYLEEIMDKYSDFDPRFKLFVAEVINGYAKMSTNEMKAMYDNFDNIQKELAVTKKAIEDTSSHINNVQSNVAFDKLVKRYLQRGFKKSQVTEDHVEAAKEAHFKRYNKEEAYQLKVLNILDKKHIDDATKDKLIGQLILENFTEVIKKKQAKGKVSKDDPTPKARIEKDAEVEKAKKELDKEEEKEAAKTLTPDEEAQRRAQIKAQLNRIKSL